MKLFNVTRQTGRAAVFVSDIRTVIVLARSFSESAAVGMEMFPATAKIGFRVRRVERRFRSRHKDSHGDRAAGTSPFGVERILDGFSNECPQLGVVRKELPLSRLAVFKPGIHLAEMPREFHKIPCNQ